MKGLVLKEEKGVVRIRGESQVVGVRVWIMTLSLPCEPTPHHHYPCLPCVLLYPPCVYSSCLYHIILISLSIEPMYCLAVCRSQEPQCQCSCQASTIVTFHPHMMSWHMTDLFIFLYFPHDSQEESRLFTFAHDSAIHMGVILYFSRDSSSHDSCRLLLTHSDSLVFHPFLLLVDSYKDLIVLVTYCSHDIHCPLVMSTVPCDVHCSCDAIVPIYYKVRPSK